MFTCMLAMLAKLVLFLEASVHVYASVSSHHAKQNSKNAVSEMCVIWQDECNDDPISG